MANNVTQTYGASRFPGMDICAKSGTAEVGEGQTPHAWFTGFLRGEDTPYAFVVLVENGGGGSSVAGSVAGQGAGRHRQRILIRKREKYERQEKGSAAPDEETDE